MTNQQCQSHVTIDWGNPDDPGPSTTLQCELSRYHRGDHRHIAASTWTEGETIIYRGIVSSLPEPKAAALLPLDLDWARRCAADYTAKPTDARARNAAQCLPGLLAAYDNLMKEAAIARAVAHIASLPAELCRDEHEDMICFLAAGHEGDHSTNVRHREPATWPRLAYEMCRATIQGSNEKLICNLPRGHRGPHADGLRDPMTRETWHGPAGERACDAPPEHCPGYPQARPEDARLACFKPAGHLGDHSNDPLWLRVGIDPCPARIPGGKKSCTKGYMHSGGHEWGPNKPIEAGPELPPDDGKRPCEGRDCTNRTTMSCARCGRQNCRMCAAINLKTMTHSDGTPCAWRCRFPDCKTPDEDPWHLHCAAPFGGLTERRWREPHPTADAPGRAAEPLTGASE